jgi:hypothetical protein
MLQKNQSKNSSTPLITGGFANMIIFIIFLLTMGGTVVYFKNFPLEKLPVENVQKENMEKVAVAPVEEKNKNATTTQKILEYAKGQYIDVAGKMKERVQDCGGGEICTEYTLIWLPNETRTDFISQIRFDFDSCVDKAIKSGDAVRVQGVIEKVVPEIGLIMSCDSSKTVVSKLSKN